MNDNISFFHSLRFKFLLGITLLVGLISLLSTINTSLREESLLSESMDQAGSQLSSTLALGCREAIIKQSFDELAPFTERIIAAGDDVQEIAIFDQDGKYLAHRKRHEGSTKLGEILPPDERRKLEKLDRPTRVLCPDTNCVLYYAPIQVGSSLLGAVMLRYSFQRLHQAQSTSRQQIVMIGLVSLLAGLGLSFLLAKYITSGIEQLVKGTQIVATGDLSYRLAMTSRDEIAMLAQRFNDMIDAVETNRKVLDRKIFEIETLFKASQTANFQTDTEKLVKQLLELAARALKAERASMMVHTEAGDELVTKIVYGAAPEGAGPIGTTRIKTGEGVAGTVLKTGQSMIVNDGYNDPLFKSFESCTHIEESIRNLISVPMKVRDRVTGVINVVNKAANEAFSGDDQHLLEALAQQAAMAVEHARLYELAITDGLTKLYIHRYFQGRLEEEILRARRYHTTVSLVLFDIDHFKKFNDTYGHQQGDIVLVETAKILKQTVRDTIDIPARYGGEEFVIILPETDSAGALLVAERLRHNIETFEYPGQGKPLHVTISLGVATFPDHASNRATLIKKADIALYACKKAGRNCSTVFNDSLAELS